MNKTFLGFETAVNQTSLGLYHNNAYQVIDSEGGRGQTQNILPNIDNLLSQYKLKPKDLHGIAYTHGPGSFTGLRVAASIIQALAFVDEIPVVGVSALKALAYAGAKRSGNGRYLVCFDAKMSEVYWAVYDITLNHSAAQIITVKSDTLSSPADFAQEMTTYTQENTAQNNSTQKSSFQNSPASEETFAVGDGWTLDSVREKNVMACTDANAHIKPNAQDIIELALDDFEQKNTLKAHEVIPVYLRDKTAWKTLEEQRKSPA